MHRRLQFGMRENPASDRRHDSRPVVSSNTSPSSIQEESAEASNSGALAESIVSGCLSPEHTAPRQVTTAKEREETCRSISPIRKPDHVPPAAASRSQVAFEPLLDIVDAARLLRIHPKTLRVKAARGIIPGVQIGRAWRFRASMLDKWLAEIANRRPGVKP